MNIKKAWLFIIGSVTPAANNDAGDGVFHLGGDTPFYSDNTDSEAIWINSL